MIHYFDNCATTRVDDNLIQTLIKYHTEKYFNPSARSSFSAEVADDIARARETVAKLLGAENYNVYFTSGGTESDNTGILGALKGKRGNIVATMSEHSAVYNALLTLQNRGYELRLANVLPDGHIDFKDFISKIDDQTLLACFMHVNNETGAVNDIKKLASAIKGVNKNTVCFSDGIQAAGKIPVNLADLNVDIYTLSGHKFHASKGTGVILVKKNLRLNPLIFGGGQEKGLRSGTEYVGGIVVLADALQSAISNLTINTQRFLHYKNNVRDALGCVRDWREICIENCSPAVMSLAFAGIKGEVLLRMLEDAEIIVGTGSACSSRNKQSRIAKAINLPAEYSEGVIRISFSKFNTEEDTRYLGEKLRECVLRLRKTISR